MSVLSDLVSEIRDLQARATTRSTDSDDQPTRPVDIPYFLRQYFSIVAWPRVPTTLIKKAVLESARQEGYYSDGHNLTAGEAAMCDSMGLLSVAQEADAISLLGPVTPGEKRPMEACVTVGMYFRDASFAALLEARLGGCWAEPPQPRPADPNPTGTGKPSTVNGHGI